MKSFDSTTGEETWITPPQIQQRLGKFDLDPCAANNMPYRTAERMVTKDEDGLRIDWGRARVWLNPPYGRGISPFLERMWRGIALLPARTDTGWFHELVAPRCDSILLVKGRIRFIDRTGKVAGAPAFASMLVGYTPSDSAVLASCGIEGIMVKPCMEE